MLLKNFKNYNIRSILIFQINAEVSAKSEMLDTTNAQLIAAQAELERSHAEYEQLDGVIEQMIEQHAAAQHETANLNELVTTIRGKNEQLQDIHVQTQSEVSSLTQRLTSVTAENEQLNSSHASFMGYYQQLQASYTVLYEQHQQLLAPEVLESLQTTDEQESAATNENIHIDGTTKSSTKDYSVQTDETQEDWCALVDRVTETEEELSKWKSKVIYMTSDVAEQVQRLKQYAHSMVTFVRTEQDNWTQMIQQTTELYVERTEQIYKEIEEQKSSLMDYNERLRSESDKVVDECEELKKDLEEYKASYDWLTNENETLQIALDAKKAEHSVLKESATKQKETSEMLKVANSELTSQLIALAAEKGSHDVSFDSSRTIATDDEVIIHDVQTELMRSRNDSISAESELSSRDQRTDDEGRSMRIKDLEVIVEQMQTKIDNQYSELIECKEQYEQEVADLLYKMEKLRCCLDEANEETEISVNRSKEYSAKYSWLKTQVAGIIDINAENITDEELVDCLQSPSSSQNQNADMEDQLTIMNEELEMATSMNEDLKHEVKALKQTQKQHNEVTVALETQLQEVQYDYGKLQELNNSLATEKHELTEAVVELKAQLGATSELKVSKEALEDRVDEFANEILRLKMQAEEVRLRHSKSVEETQRSTSEEAITLGELLRTSQENLTDWEERYEQLQKSEEHYRSQCDDLNFTIQTLESSLKTTEEHLALVKQATENDTDEKQRELDQVKQQLLQSQSQILEMSVTIERLTSEQQRLHSLVQNMEVQADEFARSQATVDQAEEMGEKYDEMEHQWKLLKIDNDKLRRENEPLKRELLRMDELKGKLEDLQLLKESEETNHKLIEKQLYDDIDELRQQVKEAEDGRLEQSSQVDQLNELLAAANSTLMATRKDSWDSVKQMQDLEKENQLLQEHLHSVNVLEQEKAQRIEYSWQQMANSSNDDVSRKLQGLAQEVSQLTSLLDNSKAEMNDLMHQLNDSNEIKMQLQAQLQEKQSLLQQQQSDVQTNESETNKSTAEVVDRLRQENGELIEQLQQTQQAIVDLRSKAKLSDTSDQHVLAEAMKARDDAFREIGMLKETVG